MAADTAHAIDPNDRAFLGQPKGLGYLAFTEGWVSFSLYGMQALLVLYMVGELLQPGHIEHVVGFGAFRRMMHALYGVDGGQPLASAVMGLYSALVYALPIMGGLVADRLLGRTRTIVIGSLMMSAGHFLLALEATFLPALALLLIGAGLSSTLKAQIGGLYAPDDLRRSQAFQVYTMSVSVAVIAAPLVCGALGEKVAFRWGFAAAGVGMLIGLATYLAGRRWLPADPPVVRAAKGSKAPLSSRDLRTLSLLAILLPVLAAAAVGNMQIYNAYVLWGKANYQLVFFGQTMPASWLLSIDAAVSLATLAGSIAFWRWWAQRRGEPDETTKAALGAAIMATAPLILAFASWMSPGKVGLGWGLAFHAVNDIGFSNVYPVGLALYARAAPERLGATVVNAYSLHIAIAYLITGWLAGLLSRISSVQFWLLHAAIIAVAALVLLVFAKLFRQALAPA